VITWRRYGRIDWVFTEKFELTNIELEVLELTLIVLGHYATQDKLIQLSLYKQQLSQV
jgi:hypothetical protein